MRLIGFVVLTAFAWADIGAQRPAASPETQGLRLTVRPHEMATGERTLATGEFTLDSLPGYLVYVPKQALGKHRVPLIVALAGGGIDSRDVMDLEQSVADKYGLILFTPDISGPSASEDQIVALDAGLKQILRRFAVDPDRIALTGMSNGGALALDIGCENLAIFHRIAGLSPVPFEGETCTDLTGPARRQTQILISNGIGEPNMGMVDLLTVTPMLHHNGYTVLPVLGLRPHSRIVRDRFFVWQWLLDSWDAPGKPSPLLEHPLRVPRLTDTILARMTRFWTAFAQMPDSIQHIVAWDAFEPNDLSRIGEDRTAIAVPVGHETIVISDFPDISALATKYPVVKAALVSAELTAKDEQRYQAAFVSARATKIAQQDTIAQKVAPARAKSRLAALTATPLVQQNVDFITKHQRDVNQLLDKMQIIRCETSLQGQYGC